MTGDTGFTWWRSKVRGPVGAGPGVRPLDIGTRIGTVAAAACARGARVTAVDAEPGMIEQARRGAPTADIRQAVLPDLPEVWQALAGTGVSLVPAPGELETAPTTFASALGGATGWRRAAVMFVFVVVSAFGPALVIFKIPMV